MDNSYSSDKFESQWKKIQEEEDKGLPKSVLKLLENLYSKAKEENNPSQIIKTLIHIVKNRSFIEEEGIVKAIAELEKEVKSSKFPTKPILHSVLAEIYWQYYQNNRYKFYNRTATEDFKQDDIRTWDLKKIVENCSMNYQKSLEDSEKSKNLSINIFDDILYQGHRSREFRPTLYDFLSHRAIDFYLNTQSGLPQPKDSFSLEYSDTGKKGPAAKEFVYLLEVDEFVKRKIETKDKESFLFQGIKIFQDLLNFRIQQANSKKTNSVAALIDADLKRLNYIHNNTNITDKNELYLRALELLEEKYKSNEASSRVNYYIAEFFSIRAMKYSPNISDDHKWDYRSAFEICSNVIKKFPKSDGAQDCRSLQQSIKSKYFSFEIEGFNVPGKPFYGLLNYRNFNDIYGKIFTYTEEDLNNVRNLYEESRKKKEYKDYIELLITYFNKKEALKSFQYSLPDDKDFHSHSTDIKFPTLPEGKYIYLLSPSKEFTFEKNAIKVNFFQNTNISFVQRELNKFSQFILMNRESGIPIEGADVDVIAQIYHSKSGKYKNENLGKLKTDAEGRFEIPRFSDEGRNYFINIKTEKDSLTIANDTNWNYYKNDYKAYYYQGRYYDYDKKEKRNVLHLFTDRAIYRPGQTVYFKGIYFSPDKYNPQALKGEKVKLQLKNPNGDKVAEGDFVTNDFGTITGTFVIPQGGLNGYFTLQSSNGSKSFHVEDYKRPKFEVTIDNLKGTYKLNDSVPVKGNAKSYSGAPIDNAKYSYRIKRKAIIPYWWRYFWGGNFSSSEQEILNGEGTTNEKGEFKIEFEAVPDKSISIKSKPTFQYMVTVDVTDINGETHSTTKNIPVGYTALELSLNIKNEINKDDKVEWKIDSKNLSGEFEPTVSKIQIFKIKTPGTAFRKRMLGKPDNFAISREEWKKDFPLDPYGDEDNVTKWGKETVVYNSEIDTSKKKKWEIEDLKNWMEGYYLIEATTKDKYGEEVKDMRYFTVYSATSLKEPLPDIDFKILKKISGEPGENAEFLINTKHKNRILYEIEHEHEIIQSEWINTENEKSSDLKLISIPIREIYRGNFGVHLTFIINNRFYSKDFNITVPFTNKELVIEYETFRDKLNPGQEEEWKVKISGKKGEKIAAEFLASMYDASLDAFASNNYHWNIYGSTNISKSWNAGFSFTKSSGRTFVRNWNTNVSRSSRSYDQLNWFGLNYRYYRGRDKYGLKRKSKMATAGSKAMDRSIDMDEMDDAVEESAAEAPSPEPSMALEKKEMAKPQKNGDSKDNEGSSGGSEENSQKEVQIRSNFSETAFFFPVLETDPEGRVIFKFKIPDSLTKWKFLGLAHTQDLKIGYTENSTVTQKDLMVVPNPPRFFREGDTIQFTSKINNLSEEDFNGEINLKLFDSLTMKPIEEKFGISDKPQNFTSKKGESGVVDWKLKIPEGVSAVTYRIIGKAGKFSDGEEMTIPILTNRMLVTESLPLPIRGKETKTYEFKKLLNSPAPGKDSSATLRHHNLTLEFTNNPAWYAVQAIPYLMEYPYECIEQTFTRYYANSLSRHIVNSNPKIKKVFDAWKKIPDSEKGALASNLEKNQELKSLLLEETPWVREAKDESTRKKRIALLFDVNKMSDELDRALNKILKLQLYEGGWSWFPNMPSDRYITQHIITGMGHLDKLGVKEVRKDSKVWEMTRKGIGYLDRMIVEDYERIEELVAKKLTKWEDNHLGYIQIHYLYSRSYFKDIKLPKESEKAFKYFFNQAQTYWLDNNRYLQGMIALGLNRFEDEKTPKAIVKSLKEHSLESEEMGMYWKQDYGYFWYQLPIETHSLMIEVFDEVAKDEKAVDALKVWLLKNKQTNDWKTTKATSEAIYSLLLRGENWLDNDEMVDITLGSLKIDPKTMPDVKIEEGTGYFKKSFSPTEIDPSMGKVTLSKKSSGVSWGALYWQYFENLDKITSHETPLKLNKKLFLQKNTDKGPILTPIESPKVKLKTGDLIKVRIELRVDRDMEYVHMKDMRASAFEPENVFSTYKYQDGLHYYESTRDAATNFFFGFLPKGTYVFEYPLRASQKGNFSNGITTIQSMYAPEFTSHSEGIRVTIE